MASPTSSTVYNTATGETTDDGEENAASDESEGDGQSITIENLLLSFNGYPSSCSTCCKLCFSKFHYLLIANT